MKITTKRIKGGASISIRAISRADKDALTEAVMSGSLMRALNGTEPTPSVFCRTCLRPIPKARLDAAPKATRCVRCYDLCGIADLERIGPDKLAKVGVVRSEGDGDHRTLGGSDYLGGIGLS